jgi:hypothetical protein
MSLLDTLPILLGQALGVPGPEANQQYAGGMLLSMAILAMVGLSLTAMLGKSRNEKSNILVTSICLFVTMGFLYVITWLPFEFLVVAMLLVGVLFAGEIKKGLTG